MSPAPRPSRSWVRVGHRLLLACVLLSLPTVLSSTPSLLAEEPPAAAPSATPPLGKGIFLIANPALPDPNFRHTVVLICEHNDKEGTLGVILNRPTGVLVSEALPDVPVLKATSYVLFWGGPVQPEAVLMLFRLGQAAPGMREVLPGIYLGGNPDMLEQVITRPNPTETFRAFSGYAGWAPGQLEYEMALGSWAIVPADSASIFDKDPSGLWMDLVEQLRARRSTL